MAILGFKLYKVDNTIYKSVTKELDKEFSDNNSDNVVMFCVFFENGRAIPVLKTYDYYWVDFANENFGYEDEDDIEDNDLKIAQVGLRVIDMKNFNLIFRSAIKNKWQ